MIYSLRVNSNTLQADRGPGKDSEVGINELIAKDVFKGAKLALSVKDAAKGITNLTVKLAGGEMINGTFDVINQTLKIGGVAYDLNKKMNDKPSKKDKDE